MDEAHFRDHVYDPVSVTDLHSYREVSTGFRREKDLDSLLLERWIAVLMINFNDLKLEAILSKFNTLEKLIESYFSCSCS